MAGYLKLWTTLSNNDAFLSLNCTTRGLYLQLLMAVKNQRDDGQVRYKSVASLSSDAALDRRTGDKNVAKLSNVGLIELVKDDNGVLWITIPNWRYWQDLDVKDLHNKSDKNVAKMRQKCPLPDQTRPKQTRPDHIDIPFQKIIDDLNQKVNKSYQAGSVKTRSLITARWKTGFRLADFQYVHEVKSKEWIGTEFEKYLRPETLYGSKFEGYRQQSAKATSERERHEVGGNTPI